MAALKDLCIADPIYKPYDKSQVVTIYLYRCIANIYCHKILHSALGACDPHLKCSKFETDNELERINSIEECMDTNYIMISY